MPYDSKSLIIAVERQLAECPKMRLGELARILHVERHAIEKVVRIERQMAFHELRRDYVLQKVFALMDQRPPPSIKEIAYAVCYNWPGDLSRLMKRTIGQTPSEILNERSRIRERSMKK